MSLEIRNLKTPQLHALLDVLGFRSFLLLCVSVLTSKSKGVVGSYFRSHYCWIHFSDNLIWSRAATCLSVHQMHLNLNHLLLIWQLLKMAVAKTEPFSSFQFPVESWKRRSTLDYFDPFLLWKHSHRMQFLWRQIYTVAPELSFPY